MKPPLVIVEMENERDRRECIALDLTSPRKKRVTKAGVKTSARRQLSL